MNFRERIQAAVHLRQQLVTDEQMVANRLRLATARDHQTHLNSLAPELEGRLHISTSLKVVEDQARKILGNPPNHSKNRTGFRAIDGGLNCQYQDILKASATAGKETVSTLNGSWENVRWSLDVFTYTNWNPTRLLTIGGYWDSQAAYENYPIRDGTTKALAAWTPEAVEEEMFQYFQRSLLH